MIDSANMKEMAKERFRAWSKERKSAPNVLYYRDGVSTGQYDAVLAEEITAIQTAWKEVWPNETPDVKITAVIAVKRHHTRFFPLPADVHKNGNCKAGILVDRGIVSPYFSEFFLQLHHAPKVTAVPTRYFVLQNDLRMSDTDLQRFVSSMSSSKLERDRKMHANLISRPTSCATHTSAPQLVSPTPHPRATPTTSVSAADNTCVTGSRRIMTATTTRPIRTARMSSMQGIGLNCTRNTRLLRRTSERRRNRIIRSRTREPRERLLRQRWKRSYGMRQWHIGTNIGTQDQAHGTSDWTRRCSGCKWWRNVDGEVTGSVAISLCFSLVFEFSCVCVGWLCILVIIGFAFSSTILCSALRLSRCYSLLRRVGNDCHPMRPFSFVPVCSCLFFRIISSPTFELSRTLHSLRTIIHIDLQLHIFPSGICSVHVSDHHHFLVSIALPFTTVRYRTQPQSSSHIPPHRQSCTIHSSHAHHVGKHFPHQTKNLHAPLPALP